MVVIKMKCICICKALCTVLGMKHVLYDWRLRYFVVCVVLFVYFLLFYSLWPQSFRIELCRKWLCSGVFELIRASLFFLPTLSGAACKPQCSTCSSGLECSSCQPPLLMRHGQCVSTCGDGFYQDRHSCAGNHWPDQQLAGPLRKPIPYT